MTLRATGSLLTALLVGGLLAARAPALTDGSAQARHPIVASPLKAQPQARATASASAGVRARATASASASARSSVSVRGGGCCGH